MYDGSGPGYFFLSLYEYSVVFEYDTVHPVPQHCNRLKLCNCMRQIPIASINQKPCRAINYIPSIPQNTRLNQFIYCASDNNTTCT